MSGYHNYQLNPVVQIPGYSEQDCLNGWREVFAHLRERISAAGKSKIVIECYPGVLLPSLVETIRGEFPEAVILNVESAYREASTLRAQFRQTLTDDPVFGIMHRWPIESYFDEAGTASLKAEIAHASSAVFVVGTGAHHVLPDPNLLLHASVTRWELQRRQRAQIIGNLGFDNAEDSAQLLYKNAFFLEWRCADDIRHSLFQKIDFFLDLDIQETPHMLAGDVLRDSIAKAVQRPFRVVPFFDPGPWGGHWMSETFDLPSGVPNYAWCFDCVPEENSVTFGFGARRFQLPAITLVHEQPIKLLGEAVYRSFGAEFPIRFDLLDTVGGTNLSLQVHPLQKYIQEHFGIPYTQDESYYILASCAGSQLYLGVRKGVDPDRMRSDLEEAQAGGAPFPVERYVNLWPTKKHDHFSIPAGTVHCSGSDNLVLEISATPYIFTFKLWDWGRLGLDGKPRPIHLEHGLANIQWNRDTGWVCKELLNQVEPVGQGDGWREERTGLHASEFLETRRTWFSKPVSHDTRGNLHVLNLVEGEAISVESPTEAFPPMEVHYAETFIVPASVGEYLIRPLGKTGQPTATIKAYLRNN
jgi:mannose-6-phosphate isomerase class I